MPVIYTLVASGFAHSGDINLAPYPRLVAIDMPVVTSGFLFIKGNIIDTTSARFTRVSDDVGDISFATGPGSKHVLWPQGFSLPANIRLELSVNQTDNRSFALLVMR